MRGTCGYEHTNGNWCGKDPVLFISRYRNENDYCVNGKRVRRYDDGTFGYEASEEDRRLLAEYDADEERKYQDWRKENAHLFDAA